MFHNYGKHWIMFEINTREFVLWVLFYSRVIADYTLILFGTGPKHLAS